MAVSDRKLCRAAEAAALTAFKKMANHSTDGSEPPPDVIASTLAQYGKALRRAAATGGRTEVAAAMKHLGSVLVKVAAAPDPEAASDELGFDEAKERLSTTCRPFGVDL